ncbi:MAG TPA: hypothetical protein VM370_04135 [Candidatus Thermoplasmatota archaeon]|nr:hypothetical protein [Candidatus Thermoplasmatota archaeon]
MRIVHLLTAAALLAVALPGVALAGKDDPLTIPLDLSAAGGPTLWLRCQGSDVATCGMVSLWQQTNKVPGLQTSVFAYGGKPWDPDTRLLP